MKGKIIPLSRPLWFVNIIKHFFPDRFKIADLTVKSSAIRKIIDYLLFHEDEIYYLTKDEVVIDQIYNKQEILIDIAVPEDVLIDSSFFDKDVIINIPSLTERVVINIPVDYQEDIVLPSSIAKHFIDISKYLWIMEKCICRDSMQCKDYPIEIGCIFLGEAVLGINSQLGHLVTKDEAWAHLQRANEMGLIQMIGRNKIDTQWMGIGPGNKLMSICNCCPCCCLYKVLPNLDRSISSKVSRLPGVEIIVRLDKCTGCGLCTKNVCFINAISLKSGHSSINEICVGCGRCVEACPQKAIELEIFDESFVQKTVERLTAKVDV